MAGIDERTRVMELRRLGTTDMRITPVGYGAWAIGGAGWAFAWGAQDDGESVAAIRHAIDRGVNWIDTAAIYGLGHSEEIVARALADIPEGERPYVFTKCGLEPDPSDPLTANRRVGRPDRIRQGIDDSLRRLGVERIDLMQMHWPADDVPLEEYWQVLVDAKAAGKLRAIGLSNHTAEQLTRAEAMGHVDTLQPPFSLIRRDAAATVLPWCAAHDTGVIVYSPMQSGLLTGAFDRARVEALPEDDWRRRNPEFTTNLPANLELVAALTSVGTRLGTTPGVVAIAWTLAFPAVTGAIVGARRPEQVDGWIDAGTLRLDGQTLGELEAALRRNGAGTGPSRP